jgi:hypothetical protein
MPRSRRISRNKRTPQQLGQCFYDTALLPTFQAIRARRSLPVDINTPKVQTFLAP